MLLSETDRFVIFWPVTQFIGGQCLFPLPLCFSFFFSGNVRHRIIVFSRIYSLTV